jgi:hypothetical protein
MVDPDVLRGAANNRANCCRAEKRSAFRQLRFGAEDGGMRCAVPPYMLE